MNTKLASRAQKLSRVIYASLPFCYRFGVLLEILSDSYARLKDSLGRTLYAEFLKAGIPMPDINNKPAEEVVEEVRRKGADALPRGYGGRFAAAIINMVRHSLAKETDTEDFLQDFLVAVLKGYLRIDPSKAKSLQSAESYVMKFVDWRIKDWHKGRKRQQEKGPKSLTDPETGGQQDVEDMSSADLRAIMNRMRPGDGDKMVRELRRVDPSFPQRAEQWLVSKMEGWSNTELAEEWGLSEGRITQWTDKFLPKMKKIFEKYFWAVAV